MSQDDADLFHSLHVRGGWPTHADCRICFVEGTGRLATVADIEAIMERTVIRMTQAFDDGLGSVRDALTADEAAQSAADARVAELLQQLADAAKAPAPADPGAVADIVRRITALTSRDTADAAPPAPASAAPSAGA